MKTFAQLLTEYAERTGVTDAELARHLGVRRQTIFRWKEGLTKRPRDRQDVLRLAEKLRLTPAERDELLLAAGFAPETPALPEAPSPIRADAVQALPALSDEVPASPARRSLPWRWLGLGLALVMVILLGLGAWLARHGDALRMGPSIALGEPARPGETLILVAQFANYGGEKLGFNVAGRLTQALEQEFAASGLKDVRVQLIPEVIETQAEAEQIGRAQRASLVIWGEYDSGRVLAHFTPLKPGADPQEIERMLGDVSELNATINIKLPQEVRWLALVAVGQMAYLDGRYDEAEALFQQAVRFQPEDPAAMKLAYFYFALLEEAKPHPDLDQIIAYNTQAIELDPNFLTPLNNRAAAYLRRHAPGDVARAIADLRRVASLAPDLASAHFNLGLALSRLGKDQAPEALAEFHRAYELDPDSPGVNNALCWTYALLQRPEEAMPFCDRAVELDPSGYAYDSRGVARAEMGDFEGAIADFQAFLNALADDPEALARFGPRRRAWIEQLRSGENPFDTATLDALFQE